MLTRVCEILLLLVLAQQSGLPSAPAPSAAAVEKATAAIQASAPRAHPILVTMVSPDYTEIARKKHISGNVEVSLVVDEHGTPRNVTVVHGVGLGLDEKAVEAVKQYRFLPATTEDGTPVATKLNVSVNFQIY